MPPRVFVLPFHYYDKGLAQKGAEDQFICKAKPYSSFCLRVVRVGGTHSGNAQTRQTQSHHSVSCRRVWTPAILKSQPHVRWCLAGEEALVMLNPQLAEFDMKAEVGAQSLPDPQKGSPFYYSWKALAETLPAQHKYADNKGKITSVPTSKTVRGPARYLTKA